MARARNIKPNFFKNELLGVCDPLVNLLFISLWTLADKAGRLEDRPLRIKAETFPYRENLDVNGYLTELASLEFICRYETKCGKYIQIINFDKHQSPHKTEKESVIPSMEKEITKSIGYNLTVKQPLNNYGLTAALPPDLLIPDSLIPDLLNDETLIADKKPAPSSPKFSAKQTLIDLGVTDQVASDFVSMRKANLTETAISVIKREADKAGFTLEDALKECVSRGWQGFKADWVNKGSQSTGMQNREAVKRAGYDSIFTPQIKSELQGRNYERPIN